MHSVPAINQRHDPMSLDGYTVWFSAGQATAGAGRFCARSRVLSLAPRGSVMRMRLHDAVIAVELEDRDTHALIGCYRSYDRRVERNQ